jgi:hypothetical protein
LIAFSRCVARHQSAFLSRGVSPPVSNEAGPRMTHADVLDSEASGSRD